MSTEKSWMMRQPIVVAVSNEDPPEIVGVWLASSEQAARERAERDTSNEWGKGNTWRYFISAEFSMLLHEKDLPVASTFAELRGTRRGAP